MLAATTSTHSSFQIGNCNLIVRQGTFNDLNCDALIIPQRSMSQRFSTNAIHGMLDHNFSAPGIEEYQRLATEEGSFSSGTALLTESGSTDFKFFLHAVIDGPARALGTRSADTHQVIEDAFLKCLNLAHANNLTSVVAPALGTDNSIKLSFAESALIMISAIKRFEASGNALNIQIVIPSKSDFDDFLSNCFQESYMGIDFADLTANSPLRTTAPRLQEPFLNVDFMDERYGNDRNFTITLWKNLLEQLTTIGMVISVNLSKKDRSYNLNEGKFAWQEFTEFLLLPGCEREQQVRDAMLKYELTPIEVDVSHVGEFSFNHYSVVNAIVTLIDYEQTPAQWFENHERWGRFVQDAVELYFELAGLDELRKKYTYGFSFIVQNRDCEKQRILAW